MIQRLPRFGIRGRKDLGASLKREEGQAAFEFMLVIPLYILFIFLLIDMGVWMYEYVSISNAAREGARLGAVNCSVGSCTATVIKNRTVGRSGGVLGAGNVGEVTVGWVNNTGSAGNSDRGDSVVVRVQHTFTSIFFPALSAPVRACADMMLEQKDKTAGLPSGTGC